MTPIIEEKMKAIEDEFEDKEFDQVLSPNQVHVEVGFVEKPWE